MDANFVKMDKVQTGVSAPTAEIEQFRQVIQNFVTTLLTQLARIANAQIQKLNESFADFVETG